LENFKRLLDSVGPVRSSYAHPNTGNYDFNNYWGNVFAYAKDVNNTGTRNILINTQDPVGGGIAFFADNNAQDSFNVPDPQKTQWNLRKFDSGKRSCSNAKGIRDRDEGSERAGDPFWTGNGWDPLCDFDVSEFLGGAVGCGDNKHFVAIKPKWQSDRLVGWDWRYCSEGQSDQFVPVSITIKFKPIYTARKEWLKDTFGGYCKSFVAVKKSDLAVGKYTVTNNNNSVSWNTRATGYYESNPATKTFLKKDLDTTNAKIPVFVDTSNVEFWKTDDFYSPSFRGSYPELNQTPSTTKKCFSGPSSGCWGYDIDSYTTPTGTAPSYASYHSTYNDLAVGGIDTLRDVFGKAYEYWSSVNGPIWQSIAKPYGDFQYYKFGDYVNRAFSSLAPGDTAYDSAANALRSFWNTSKTNAQASAPVIYRAYQNTESGHESEYSFLPPIPSLPLSVKAGISAGGFTFEHNKRAIYQNVKIRFYVDVGDDQLPMRKLIVDWGDYVSNRSVLEDKNDENTGKKDNPGTATFTTTAPPYTFSHMYRDTPVGKTICIYAMDNWEAKSAVCGKIVKQANGDLEISNFVTKRGADYTATDIDSTKWPPTVKGNCSFGSGATHTGVDDNATSSGAIRCPF